MKRFGFAAFGFSMLCATAFGQSTLSHIELGASNTDYRLPDGGLLFPVLESYETTNGSSIDANFQTSFTGLNRNYEEQTMDFNGYAFAQGNYGMLRTHSMGTLSNSFYNFDNDPFVDSTTGDINFATGVPDVFSLNAQAGWTDNLQVGGTANNYYSTWVFNVSGVNQGDGAFSFLRVKIGNNESKDYYFFDSGAYNYTLRTSEFVLGSTPEDVEFTLYSIFQPVTQYHDDGVNITGDSNFGHTVVLDGVEFRDQSGNLLNDVTVSSASGYKYEAVPEPSACLAVGAGLIGFLKRRRAKAA
jgi:hypothetical protein